MIFATLKNGNDWGMVHYCFNHINPNEEINPISNTLELCGKMTKPQIDGLCRFVRSISAMGNSAFLFFALKQL